MVELKRYGLRITKHYPIISTTDLLEKLYKRYLFNIDIPLGLMNKVQFDDSVYSMRRGVEDIRIK